MVFLQIQSLEHVSPNVILLKATMDKALLKDVFFNAHQDSKIILLLNVLEPVLDPQDFIMGIQ